MRVVVVGAGGVGAAVAAIARRRGFFEQMTLADLDRSQQRIRRRKMSPPRRHPPRRHWRHRVRHRKRVPLRVEMLECIPLDYELCSQYL